MIKEGIVEEKWGNGKRLRYDDYILPPKAHQILRFLLRHKDMYLSTVTIIREVWGENHYVDEHAHGQLRIQLYKVRKFLREIESDLRIERDNNYKIAITVKETKS